ncbi:pentatricopeptide repeat-containing protein, partial [Trifolium medium]|nr:pentatricopeptide repeat-containing protein [Trifolium medium]
AKLTEEKKSADDRVAELEAAIAPINGEPEEAFGLVTRADLVGKIKEIAGDCLAALKFGWKNAIAQLKLLNSDVELKTEGMGMLKEVRDGRIVPLPGYQSDSESEEEGESARMDGVEHQRESAHEDDPSNTLTHYYP